MNKRIYHGTGLLFFLTSFLFQVCAQGDRNAGENEIYPPYCFVNTETSIDSNATVNVIDVTKFPFFAKPGDGVDDTKAICQAINWATRRADDFGWRHPGLERMGPAGRYIVYIPNGTYDISDKLTVTSEVTCLHDGDTTQSVNRRIEIADMDVWSKFCIIGQNKDSTILRLADNAAGFGPGTKKPVIDCNPSDKFNNNLFGTVLRNFTIHTGSGNPGAVGIEYQNANTKSNSVRNIRIVSDDHTGYAGIRTHIGSVHGYLHDITIEGFDYGVTTENETDVVFCLEHLTLRDQQIAGMKIEKGAVTLRKILSQNEVPAIILGDARVPLLDSRLESTGNSGTAIVNTDGNGILFARNIEVGGYASAIQMLNDTLVHSGHIDEFVSTEPVTLWDKQIKKSLNVPIKDAPVIPSVTAFSQWARPADYGELNSNGQYSTEAVQAALNSGKPVVAFPYAPVREEKGTFTTTDYNDKVLTFFTRLKCNDQGYERHAYEVPASVKQIKGFYRQVKDFVITEASDTPLYIQDVMASVTFKAPRPVIIEGGRWVYIRNQIEQSAGEPAELFMNCGGVFRDAGTGYPMHVYSRFLDVEGGTRTLVGKNMRMVVLSHKTEFSYHNNFDVTGGGILEIFGAKHLVANENGTFFINNDNSYVSMAASMPKENSRGSREYEIREVRGDEERLYSVPDGRSIGLYAGYTGFNQVSVIDPKPDQSFLITDSVRISAEALDFNHQIDSVQFYVNDSLIGSSDSVPYEHQWSGLREGEYEIHVMAYRDSGDMFMSPKVPITIYGYRKPDDLGNTAHGIIYEYYEGQWDQLPDYSSIPAIKKDTIGNFTIDQRERDDAFGFRFTTYIQISQEGLYTFYIGSDDGSRLYIGDRMVIDNDGIHTYNKKKGSVLLKEGLHKLVITMFDHSEDQYLLVKYEGPGIDYGIIPDSILFRPVGNPPQVSVISPDSGDAFNSTDTVRCKVALTDPDDDVHKIRFFLDERGIGSMCDSAGTFDLTIPSSGNHTIKAVAYDLGGMQSASNEITIYINTPPVVSFLSPSDSSEYTGRDTIIAKAEVTDDNIKQVKFYVNERLTKTLFQPPWQLQFTGLSMDNYYIRVTATDEYNLEASAKILFRVVNTPPQISIIQPADGDEFDAGETIEFKASVDDPDDDVYKVAFFYNDIQIGENANIFNTTTVRNLADGLYNIVAKAFDKGGAVSVSDTVSIKVGYISSTSSLNDEEILTIYPNPLKNDVLKIQSGGLFRVPGQVDLEIKDMTGHVVYLESFVSPADPIILPHSVFPGKGIYIVTIRSGHEIVSKKVVTW